MLSITDFSVSIIVRVNDQTNIRPHVGQDK